MSQDFHYKPKYGNSFAVVIGIDRYQNAPPLGYAVSDAAAVRDLLIGQFKFLEENVVYLIDGAATSSAINQAMALLAQKTDFDDRVIFFYAGHGHTESGRKGNVGFLVPVEGDVRDFSTLLRWQELVGATQLIQAKHVLFIMDACYSGLATQRALLGGSTRFLKDMMRRRACQVITAGKADQVVADVGGPLENHSVFTGHLLEGLRGGAEVNGGLITANSLMAYVYTRVSGDPGSYQTPHYGSLDGDGDFIFQLPQLEQLDRAESGSFDDILVSIPHADEVLPRDAITVKVDRVKALLADGRGTIELHDRMMAEVRQFIARTAEDAFAIHGTYSTDQFLDRLANYEQAVMPLSLMLACLSYWGDSGYATLLSKSIGRAVDRIEVAGGLSVWLALRWYPVIVACYTAGVAAVEAEQYGHLAGLLSAPANYEPTNRVGAGTLAEALSNAISEYYQYNLFKQVPGHEQNHVPLSEYLLKLIQPKLDDIFFMGKAYERAFDRFEVLFHLFVVDVKLVRKEHVWGPPGRFRWKANRFSGPTAGGPASDVIAEGRASGAAWAPLRANFFGGSVARFEAAAVEMEKMLARSY